LPQGLRSSGLSALVFFSGRTFFRDSHKETKIHCHRISSQTPHNSHEWSPTPDPTNSCFHLLPYQSQHSRLPPTPPKKQVTSPSLGPSVYESTNPSTPPTAPPQPLPSTASRPPHNPCEHTSVCPTHTPTRPVRHGMTRSQPNRRRHAADQGLLSVARSTDCLIYKHAEREKRCIQTRRRKLKKTP